MENKKIKKKLISWNVNGIRACMKKGFMDFFEKEKPDFLCLQETKVSEGIFQVQLDGYHQYWNYAEKKGYSGTAIFSKEKALFVQKGIGIEEHDNEGRVITLEFNDYYLVTVYTPNSKRELLRLDYRKRWDADFLMYVKELESKKPVIFCGDLNVAHKEIDLKNDKSNMTTAKKPGNAGFTDTEREDFTTIVESGFIDTFRHFYPDKESMYSWWSYMFNSRANNTGWRIDYFCVSEILKENLIDAKILTEVMGSDHCPVELDIEL